MGFAVRLETHCGKFSNADRAAWEAAYDLLKQTLTGDEAEVKGKFLLTPDVLPVNAGLADALFTVIEHNQATTEIVLIINPPSDFADGLLPVWQYKLDCPIQSIKTVLDILNKFKRPKINGDSAVAKALEVIGDNVGVIKEAADRLTERHQRINEINSTLARLKEEIAIREEKIGELEIERMKIGKLNAQDHEAQEASRVLTTLGSFIGD